MFDTNQKIKSVEFIGIPGSGKTTISNIILENTNVNALGYKFIFPLSYSGKLYRFYYFLYLITFIFTRPVLLALLLSSFNLKNNLKMRLQRALKTCDLACRLKLHSPKRSLIVLDQGPLQALWSWKAAGGSISHKRVPWVIKALYDSRLPDYVVYVDIDPTIAAERSTLRALHGGNPTQFDEISKEEKAEVFKQSLSFLKIINASILELGVDVITLNGKSDPDDNAAQLRKML